MLNRRSKCFMLKIWLLMAGLTLNGAVISANEPYSIELKHHGEPYKVRVTVEGVGGVKPKGQGTGNDYAILEGHAEPEGNITVTMEWTQCDGDADDIQFKQIDVWMGNRATNGDAMRDDDEQQFTRTEKGYGNDLEKVVYSFNLQDAKDADPSSDGTLMVSASSTLWMGNDVSETTFSLTIKLDGKEMAGDGNLHYKEDNAASDKKGSEIYTIPLLIGGALGAGEWFRRWLKNRNKQGNDGNDGEDDDENQAPDQLEMEIYKDFGDTLVSGDAPQRVSACIVRHPADGGPEFVDEGLTQMIRIFADDGYTAIDEEGMINGWKCALVQAPDWEKPPAECVVHFKISSPEASYTNSIHFNVMKGQVVFGQDNLTIPARYDKKVELPFLLQGMEEVQSVKAAITPEVDDDNEQRKYGHPGDYEVNVEWNAQLELWQCVITDRWKDDDQEGHIPGDCLDYFLDVEAVGKNGMRLKGRIRVFRFYMGLALQMERPEVACYLEEYDPVHHTDGLCVFKREKYITPAQKREVEMTPAETRIWLKYYTYDEDAHRIVTIDPTLAEDEQGRDDHGRTYKRMAFSVKAADDSTQQAVDALGLQLVLKTTATGAPWYLLRCRGGILNSPNRFNVVLSLRCRVGEEEAEVQRNVTLLSQPRRSYASPSDMLNEHNEDNRERDKLETLDNTIYAMGLEDRLSPLVNYIRLQLDNYHKDFGFDRDNVRAIFKTWNTVVIGEQGDAMQNPLVASDNLQEEVWAFFQAMRTTIDDMPTYQKIFASIATFGLFDVATGVIEVVGVMKDYVDKGGDSVLGAFYVGVKEVTKKYLIEKAANMGMSAAKNLWKSGGSVRGAWDGFKGEVKDMVTKEVNSVKEFGRKYMAARNAKAAQEVAKKKADEMVREATKHPKPPKENLTKDAIQKGRKRAKENLDKLQKAINEVKKSPTEINIAKRNELINVCQKDKQTMMMLKGQSNYDTIDACNLGVNFGEVRAVVNRHLDSCYRITDNRMKHYLAKQVPGLNPNDVKVICATSSAKDNLLSGKTITFDRDITFCYKDKLTGEIRYFNQEITEKLYAKEFQQVAGGSSIAHFNPMKSLDEGLSETFAKEMDQTVIENVLTHRESYGVDLARMIKEAFQGEKLVNPKKVADAVFNKGNDRFQMAEKILEKLKGVTDPEEITNIQATAIGEMLEGCRQQVKVFDLLNARDIARTAANGGSRISSSLREAVEVLRRVSVKGNTDIKTASDALEYMGYSFQGIFNEMSDLVMKIG